MLALSGVVISYVAISPAAHVSRLKLTTNFLSYFTIQANILFAVALLSAEIAPSSAFGRWAGRSSTKTALLIYVGVAGCIYAWLLKDVWHPSGWQLRGDQILHYCVPLLAVVDWLFLVERNRLAWRDAIWWLLFPALYSIYSLVHGYLSRFYPYPFLDVRDIGLQAVLINMAFLGVLFLALGGTIILLDRVAARFGLRAPPA
ncbi:Pr6Pr family membrane protein [Rhizobium freirei]|uniref:Pr6Pr family membrane protein n=1 Tax=Rhizobium freirei TaxID=1353277 RepID=UPI001F0B1CCF|nr:Pr6Pr family membrane protein [Rhizobium freirei]